MALEGSKVDRFTNAPTWRLTITWNASWFSWTFLAGWPMPVLYHPWDVYTYVYICIYIHTISHIYPHSKKH